jgi:hypothetical protein
MKKQKWIYLVTWKKVKYTHTIGRAIEEMGHTVELIFTGWHAIIKTFTSETQIPPIVSITTVPR